MIEIKNVVKTYKEDNDSELVVYSDLSLTICDAERVILFGASGSGKSTLLNLIAGIDNYDEGEIIVNDINLSKISEQEKTLFRRKNIGFIFQDFNLIPTLTVFENVTLSLELNSLYISEYINHVNNLLKIVGLFNKKNSYPEQLSGGEKQRVAIVRALAHKPSLVLADEPTGNLDKATAKTVINVLDALVREYSPTIILVTHDTNLIEFGNSVYTLIDGDLKIQNAA